MAPDIVLDATLGLFLVSLIGAWAVWFQASPAMPARCQGQVLLAFRASAVLVGGWLSAEALLFFLARPPATLVYAGFLLKLVIVLLIIAVVILLLLQQAAPAIKAARNVARMGALRAFLQRVQDWLGSVFGRLGDPNQPPPSDGELVKWVRELRTLLDEFDQEFAPQGGAAPDPEEARKVDEAVRTLAPMVRERWAELKRRLEELLEKDDQEGGLTPEEKEDLRRLLERIERGLNPPGSPPPTPSPGE